MNLPRLRPNLFGIPFGLAGLAACWTAAPGLVEVPRLVATLVWVLAAAAWLVVLVPYAGQVLRGRRLVAELADPTFGPFTAVPAMLVMLLGGALAEASRTAGVAGLPRRAGGHRAASAATSPATGSCAT